MTEEVRYWDRLGIYVSREFAEEYIEKTKAGGGGMRGEYLDADIEEFQTPTTVSPNVLRKEVEEIFSDVYQKQIKVIIPNMTPIDAMIWLKNRGTTSEGYPTYLFSSFTLNRFIYADLKP